MIEVRLEDNSDCTLGFLTDKISPDHRAADHQTFSSVVDLYNIPCPGSIVVTRRRAKFDLDSEYELAGCNI